MPALNELSPLDIIRAGKWHSALFTTYALSLGFFEGVVLPSLQRSGARDITILSDMEGVIGALSEAGARHVGRAYAVDPVRVQEGVFHPKLGVLLGDGHPHLLIGSGNLTFGGWGHNIELLEHLTAQAHPAAFGDAANFLRVLAQTPRVSTAHSRNLDGYAVALDTAANGALEGRMRLLHNLDRGISTQLVEFAAAYGGAQRLTVAAPYFGGPQAVQGLARDLGLEAFEVHVGNKLAVNGHHFDFDATPQAKAIVLDPLRGSDKDRPLHAKLIEIVCSQARLIFSGSVNASRRALSEPKNVELGVLRIVDDRIVFARELHSGPMPALPEPVEETSTSADAGVLQASYKAGLLKGRLLTSDPAGEWEAITQAGDARETVSDVAVDDAGHFTIDAAWLEQVMFKGQRTTLALRRGSETVRGFVSFPDLLSAARRLGTIAAPLLRLTGDGDDDDDWITIFEWFARNPDSTARAWGGPRAGRPAKEREDILVPVSALGAQPDRSGSESSDIGSGSHTADLLLSRLRLVIGGHTSHPPSQNKDDSDDPADERAAKGQVQKRKKLSDSFNRLIEVLAERVPHSPADELHRLAEIGVFWLLRHLDEPERRVTFLERWLGLASQYLRLNDDDAILRALTISLIALDATHKNNPALGRRRLIDILGTEQLSGLRLQEAVNEEAMPALSRLVEASVGLSDWRTMLDRMEQVRIGLDDVRSIVSALQTGATLPPVEAIGFKAELIHLHGLIERGSTQNIHCRPRTTRSCPKNHISLPAAGLEQFRQFGIARLECCNGILLRSDT